MNEQKVIYWSGFVYGFTVATSIALATLFLSSVSYVRTFMVSSGAEFNRATEFITDSSGRITLLVILVLSVLVPLIFHQKLKARLAMSVLGAVCAVWLSAIYFLALKDISSPHSKLARPSSSQPGGAADANSGRG